MRFKRTLAIVSCALMLGTGLPMPAHAALVSSAQLLQGESTARDKINAFLARAEVQRQLVARGVEPAEVKARVAALSDDQAQDLAARIDQLPAGGDAGVGDVLGVLLLIFVILLITDILGLTKVFPFTRPIHR
ncbi:MAG TPA: PA2779 family protein [Burkholderiaceae bacterium]|nr:PA2779 family protein [Burkholderiaceae bacterium]